MREMAQRAWDRGQFFFYVRIPESLDPEQRINKYEIPIGSALQHNRLGKVSGGGTQLGPNKTIAYCGIDVVLRERVRGLEFLRLELARLGAPPETVIEEFIPKYVEHPLATAE